MSRAVSHYPGIMTAAVHIIIYLGYPFKIYSVIRFIIKQAAVVSKAPVRAYGYELIILLYICHVPGVAAGIHILFLISLPLFHPHIFLTCIIRDGRISPYRGIAPKSELCRPVILRDISRMNPRDLYRVIVSRIRIKSGINVYRIIKKHEARLSRSPAVPCAVVIYYRLGISSPVLAVPLLERTVGLSGSRKKHAVHYALLS